MTRNILLNWQMSNFSGWGILGLNLFSQWIKEPGIRPIMGIPVDQQDTVMVDPLRMSYLLPAFIEANKYLSKLSVGKGGSVRLKGTVIDGLGNDLKGGRFIGQTNVGRCVFEDTTLPDARERLSRYEHLLCGSNWNASLLSERTGRPVKVLLEGVDPSIFCPGPKSNILDPKKFYVFSGGKVEYRKAQDLTLLAFREFSRRHSDAVLVTAWHSLWPRNAVGLRGRLDRPIVVDSQGTLDIMRWVFENGIDPARVIDLRPVPNPLIPVILRDMDVCVQPSRAEGCTNLPLTEAMACGVPVICALNTGMRDLITSENSIPLEKQSAIAGYNGMQTDGWGESDIDELLTAMERAYERRDEARAIGRQASNWISQNGRTWAVHAKELLAWATHIAD
jgi:glycosyltransferase involved in cell wall biosynthesis